MMETRLKVLSFGVKVISPQNMGQLPVIEYAIHLQQTDEASCAIQHHHASGAGHTTTMNSNRSIRLSSRHRGIALVLVVLVMALAGIMAYAMLSASSLQATASANAVAAATARAQAESGIHLAMYYLLNANGTAPCYRMGSGPTSRLPPRPSRP